MIGLFVLAMFATNVAEDAKAPDAAPADDKKVCRAQVDTGSRLGKRRVCRTAAEWRALDNEAGQTMEGRQRSGIDKVRL